MNEITIRSALQIINGNLAYSTPSQYAGFTASMANAYGPTPGATLISPNGTDIDLSKLTTLGGVCQFANQDSLNWVEYGIWDTVTLVFYPLGQLLPGESFVLRLSPNLRKEEVGTGTVPATGITTLRFKSNNQPVWVLVDAFPP